MKTILLLAAVIMAAAAINAVTIPYAQSFDEFTLPEGWTQTYSGSLGSDCWTVSGTNEAGGSPNEMLASYQYAIGTSRLISPPIDTQGLSAIALSFLHMYDDYGIGVTARIQYSHDLSTWHDTSWSILGGYGDVSGSVNIFVLGLDNQPVTYVAWVIEGDHYQFDYWYVDNVNVLHPPLHEVAAISIDMPAVGNSEPMLPQATFGNNGLSIETFDATIQIGSYTDTQTITDLFPGTTQPVCFDTFIPDAYNTFSISVTALLMGDENPGNNSISAEMICLPLDVQAYADCAYDPSYVNSGPCTFNLKSPGTITDLAAANPFAYFLAGADWINDSWYGVEFNPAGSPFWQISAETGNVLLQGTGSVGLSGIAYDERNHILYATNGYNLYTLSSVGIATLVGSLHLTGESNWDGNMISIAYDSIDRVLYGIDIVYDRLFTIDTSNALCTLKPYSLGIDLDFAQDCAFDRDHGLLYLAGYTTTGGLYWIDTQTGSAHLIGPFQGGAELVGFAIPYHELLEPASLLTSDGTLTWTAVDGAARYRIYSADEPYENYTYETSTSNLYWNIPDYSATRKFYVVTATSIPIRTALNLAESRNLPGKIHSKRNPASAAVFNPFSK